jgi:hypothetical protein
MTLRMAVAADQRHDRTRFDVKRNTEQDLAETVVGIDIVDFKLRHQVAPPR